MPRFRCSRRRLTLLCFVAGLPATGACGGRPAPAASQKGASVGFLSVSVISTVVPASRRGLRDLGYIEGSTVAFEDRATEGGAEAVEAVEALARELLGRPVDVLVFATPSVARSARRVSETAPVVVVYGDRLASMPGVVESLARPGGNVTGLTTATTELSDKRLELLKAAAPSVSRVALRRWREGVEQPVVETVQAARALGVELRVVEVSEPAGFGAAFAAMREAGAEALLV